MNVGELRQVLENSNLDDEAPVYLADFGYRSSNLSSIDEAMEAHDDRPEDDYGNAKEPQSGLYLLNGGTGNTRYPPEEVQDAWR